jgi:gamma-glutamyltranspeptidase/glutathione hydrolase
MYLGDPAFVSNPLQRLLSPAYAAAIREHVDPERATPSQGVQPGIAPHESMQTTHYSVVDSQGNAVSVTYTLNGLFGSGVMPPGTGVMLNNEMDDFTVKPGVPNLFGLVQDRANDIQPGKRPLSSMTPTLVTRDGHVVMVLGSPGGSRIISIVLQVLLNVIDHGMQPQEAVDAPRIHHQWLPDAIFAEPYALSPDTRRLLEAAGYRVIDQSPWGAAELIEIPQVIANGPASSGNDSALGSLRPGLIYGAHDDRRPAGSATGY